MERLVDVERAAGRGHPERESKAWIDKLEECDRLRKAYQQQQAAGLMTLEELGAMLRELEGTREVAEAELENVTSRRDRVAALENDRDDLLECMAGMVPEGLDGLTGEERNRLYRMLRLEVTPTSEGYEVGAPLVVRGCHQGDDAAPVVFGDPRRELHALAPEIFHGLLEAPVRLEGHDGAALDPCPLRLAAVEHDAQAIGLHLGPITILLRQGESQGVLVEVYGPVRIPDRQPDVRHAQGHVFLLL
jgi:hypothetical protein